jgi:DNA polymerase-3 subunit beta
MPEGLVNLNLKDNRMVVQSGKSRFSLQTLAANEFPMMQENLQDVRSLSMTQHEFKQLIGQVYFAMAQQDIRYYLNGMLFVLEGSKLIAVATDGHRLAYGQIILSQPITGDLAKLEVIVPRKTILECQHLLEEYGSICGGNIGVPLSHLDEKAPIWILETSSFLISDIAV